MSEALNESVAFLDPADAQFGTQARMASGAGPLIELRDVTKRFGSRVALDRFSLAIDPGSVVGILGPNGAGKTTLISIVAGLSRPDEGALLWRGGAVTAPFPRQRRREIGLVTQDTALYTELTVRQNLRFAADLFGVPRDRSVGEALNLVGLADRAKDRAGSLSGGMQRRVALARAMLHDPSFLVLDEPTLGVDVEARHALWGHVRSLRRNGTTILISTNHLDEAEALCDRILVLRDGRQVADGAPAELLARAGRCIEIDCQDAVIDDLRSRLQVLSGVRRVDVNAVGLTVHVEQGHSPDLVASAALTNQKVQGVRVRAPDMLEVFRSLTESPNA